MTPRAAASTERGMVLLNVLAIVGVASAAVAIMLAGQDVGAERSIRFRDAARALAVARGGELSALVALRRDAIDAPANDHAREPWAAVAQADTPIEGGRFRLSVEDAQGKFNVNSLVQGGLAAEDTFARLCETTGASRDLAVRTALYLRATGPVGSLADLRALGIEGDTLARLSSMVTALPPSAGVNVNSADERLLGVMLSNPVAVGVLASRRRRQGYLTPADVAAARVLLPPGLGYTSDHFLVRTEVEIGDTRLRLESHLERRIRGGRPEVVVVGRQRKTAAP